MTSLFDFAPKAADGTPYPLDQHRGQVVLVVNTASKCGFTPQYEGLEALWRKHREEGLVVLGFPCNQFGAQEPGDAGEIAQFCSLTYDVSFPVLAKVEVNGAGTDPVFAHLKQEKPGLLGTKGIKWNFTSSSSAATVRSSAATRPPPSPRISKATSRRPWRTLSLRRRSPSPGSR